MSDIQKIVELILSDDETNQELGMMMAVSQGVKNEVEENIQNGIYQVIANKYPVKKHLIDSVKINYSGYYDRLEVGIWEGSNKTGMLYCQHITDRMIIDLVKRYIKLCNHE